MQAILLLTGAMITETLTAQYCTMACNNLVNVSLPSTCETEIIYNMVLENANNPDVCSPNDAQAFSVAVMYQSGITIPGSPFVNASFIGKTLSVKVKHLATGNSCWGNVYVEDKLPPQMNCPPDLTVQCNASLSPAKTGSPTVSDCSGYTLTYSDQFQNNNCENAYAGDLTRTWKAVDGNSSIQFCSQLIHINQGKAGDVKWPLNLDGMAAPALDCVNPKTAPSNTGFPAIDGLAIPNGTGFCNMSVTYSDQTLPMCQNSYKILRNWTVAAWCTSTILNHVQIVAVMDTKPPVLTCPADLTVGTTSAQFCTASVTLPQVAITDDCSTIFDVTMNTPAGLITGNGGLISNVGLGIYAIKYNVNDNCGNLSSCTMKLNVIDDDPPTVICDEHTVITLNNTGSAAIFPATFDDGSYDNCGIITLTVRRMQAACGVQPVDSPSVKFCCEDAGKDVLVQMKATDQSGNVNSCMVTVHVDDKSKPVIQCPADKTLACSENPANLSLTGNPIVSTPCGIPTVTFSDVKNLNSCNVGTIARTWTATAENGNSSTCVQTITMVDNTPVSVTFPPNYTASACTVVAELIPVNLPPPYNAPVTGSDCELLATSYTDQVFTVAAPACFKIVRTWKVINWCTYQPNGGTTGLWQAQQIITVMDNTAPTFTCPAGFTVGVGANCKGTVTLPPVTDIQDCSQNVSTSISHSLGSGYGPFQNVNPGTYPVKYAVSDGCGNTSSCTINVLIKDDKNPTPYCEDALVITLMGVDTDNDGILDDGMAVTWAADFNVGSYDNCPGALKFSFSPDVNDISATFNCDDRGQNELEMWVTDAAGNQDFCHTSIIIEDNAGVCAGPPQVADIVGAVTNEEGADIENATISINDGVTPPAITGPDGNFSFPAIPFGNDYTVTAEKNSNLLNGVTTYDMVIMQRHILGIDTLRSPYKMIAADVNRSNTITTLDMVLLRKAILFISAEFPGNKSWRFIDANYIFPNPRNPFQEMLPEVFNINNFDGSFKNVKFIAVKIGDVNGTASPNSFTQPNEDRSGGALTFQVADMTLEQNKTYQVDFEAENFTGISGYQFTLHFDPEKLEFIKAVSPPVDLGLVKPLQAENFGFSLLEQGAIPVSWNDFQPVNFPANAVVFSLVFRARRATALSEVLSMRSDLTPPEAYRFSQQGEMEMLDIGLQFIQRTEQKPNYEQMAVTVSPNPFRETTVIGFSLPEAQEATLNVFDPAGRLLKTLQGSFGAGYQTFNIEGKDLPGTGIYFYRLQTSRYSTTGKLLRD